MRPRLLLAVATSLVLGLVGVAVATHVPQVDPATVPTGFVATHNHVAEVPEASFRRIAGAPGGLDTHVQHVRLTAGTDTGWHTHPGPAVVSVVKGELRYEDACRRATYGPGTGFVDAGFGHVHHAIAGSDGAEFYVTYLLPHGAPQHFIPAEGETRCHDDDD
jgi:quercetin dioxygenase-like cupin family protein